MDSQLNSRGTLASQQALLMLLVSLGLLLLFVACVTKEEAGPLPDPLDPTAPALSRVEATATPSISQDEVPFAPELWPISQVTDGMIILGDTSDYPDGCQPDEVARAIQHFLDAYNEGQVDQLTTFFVPNFQIVGWEGSFSDFVWGPEDERMGFNSRNAEAVLEYINRRHEQQDQLQLLLLQVTATLNPTRVHVGFVLRRQAADLQPGLAGSTHLGIGRGMMACPTQKLVSWNMGMSEIAENETELYHMLSPCSRLFTQIPDELVVCARPNNSPAADS
jgi:hypothetical protein